MDRPPTPPLDLARMWSPRVRATIGVLVVAYIVELAFGGVLEPILSLRGLGAGFQPWQPLTFTLIQGEPLAAVFGWVGVFFFMDIAHDGMGARHFWRGTFITWALATFGSLMIGLTGWLQATYVFGPWWWLDAMLVWFAFKNRDAQVRWMMVLPMKAEVIAWLVLLLSVLRLVIIGTSPRPTSCSRGLRRGQRCGSTGTRGGAGSCCAARRRSRRSSPSSRCSTAGGARSARAARSPTIGRTEHGRGDGVGHVPFSRGGSAPSRGRDSSR